MEQVRYRKVITSPEHIEGSKEVKIFGVGEEVEHRVTGNVESCKSASDSQLAPWA